VVLPMLVSSTWGQPLTTQPNSLFKHRIPVPAASENELCEGQEEVL
jgi:hypothetical protein